MIGDSDEERQVACGTSSNTNQVQRYLDDKLSSGENIDRCRQVPESDTEVYLCTHPPSPVHRIPYDVLRTIFELYCQVELPVNFPLWIRPPQFIVSQACSVWRQIMLDTAAFWNKIRITFDMCARYDKMVEVPRIWLSRSKNLPCFIDFNFILFRPREPLVSNRYLLWKHDINKNIVRDLIALHKFKSLGVAFTDYHLHDIFQLSDEKLSCIEILRLDYVHDDNNRETVTSQLDFHRLSNLTSFSLNTVMSGREARIPGKEYPYFQMFSSIPWHQLRHIHLGVELPALRCLDILETCSSVLETCSFVVFEDHPFASSSRFQIKPVYCPQLRELKCRIYPNIMLTHGDSFLLCLRLPKLKSLKLLCPRKSPASIDPRTLLRMQSICSIRPEELRIDDHNCDVDAGALLASMPSLRCLEVPERSMFTLDAIRELGAGSIGPFLEELAIRNPKISNELGELI